MKNHPYNYIIKREDKYGHYLMTASHELDTVDWQWTETSELETYKRLFDKKVVKLTYDEAKRMIEDWSNDNRDVHYYIKRISEDKL